MTDDLVSWLHTQLDADERGLRAWLDSTEHMSQHIGMTPWEQITDIAAKRAILDELCGYDQVDVTLPGGPPEAVRGRQSPIAGPLARLLASAYSTRPGYREEWRP